MEPKTKPAQTANQSAAIAEAEGEQPMVFNSRRSRRMARMVGEEAKPSVTGEPISAALPAAPKRNSKIASLIALLERPEGATLAEMVAATGWLPHTTRAALTGLKKKGHSITRDKRDGMTCYRIVRAG
jgi:hypothetical protein